MKVEIRMVMKNIRLFSLLALVITFAACNYTKDSDKKLYVINVLDDVLYKDAHIKGSVQVSLSELEDKARTWNKDATVVAYCSNYACTASSYAARVLQSMGFKKVYAYEGGMAEWYQLHKEDMSYGVEGDAQESYLHVVMTKPETNPEGVNIITAQELKELLTSVN